MSIRAKLVYAAAAASIALSACIAPAAAFAEGFSGSVTMDSDIQPLTIVTVEYGASWDYGSIPIIHGWSNLTSSSRWHSSTVTAAGASSMSGNTKPGVTSYADLWFAAPTFNAYYNIW